MNRTLALLAAAALVAAPVAAAPPSPAVAYSNRLKALSDLERRGAIRAAIRESGAWCKRIDRVAYQGPYRNLVMWTAHCGPQPIDYGIFIGPDGTVQVRSCADLVTLKLPACRPIR